MPKKKRRKRKVTKKKPEKKNKDGLNIRQELFCYYYVMNSSTRGNGGLSYAVAYNKKTDSLSRERKKNKKGMGFVDSDYDKAMNACYVEANRLLRNPKVCERMKALLNEILEDDVVDAELARIILQDHKWEAKLGGIREYNKLRQRIVDKMDLTVNRPYKDLSDEELSELIKEGTKFLRKE